jgi:hypothetical protein
MRSNLSPNVYEEITGEKGKKRKKGERSVDVV